MAKIALRFGLDLVVAIRSSQKSMAEKTTGSNLMKQEYF
jgi:hypothetical protein